MKPFRIKFLQRKPKVNPKSKELADTVVLDLIGYGITNKDKQARCALDMLNAVTEYFQAIQKGKSVDECIVSATDKMKSTLATAGIESVAVQEEIILKFWNTFNEIVIKEVQR